MTIEKVMNFSKSCKFANHRSDIAKEKQNDQNVQDKFVPVLLAGHLNDTLFGAGSRRVRVIYLCLRGVDQVPLVLELSIRIDHHTVRLYRNTFDTFDLVVCLIQVIDSVEQALPVAFSELHVGAFERVSIHPILVQGLRHVVLHLEVLLAQVGVLFLQTRELLTVVRLVRVIEQSVSAV